MADKNLIMDPDKLKELQSQLLKLKQDLGKVNDDIKLAINVVSKTWKDFKFDDFQNTYKNFQTGIVKFETDLGSVSNETLPPLIKAAEDYKKTSVTNN